MSYVNEVASVDVCVGKIGRRIDVDLGLEI